MKPESERIDRLSRIKQTLLKLRLNSCRRRYQKKESRMKYPYQRWIETMEKKPAGRKALFGKGALSLMSAKQFADILRNCASFSCQSWICVCMLDGRTVMPSACQKQVFVPDSDAGLVYGDEDMCCAGKRYGAWFKPDDSPDTLFSFFYYGSQLFLKTDLLQRALLSFPPSADLTKCTDRQCIYDFVLYYTEWLAAHGKRVVHIPQILFHAEGTVFMPEDERKPEAVNEAAYWGFEPEYDACKAAAAVRRGYQITFRTEKRQGRIYHIPVYALLHKEPEISIVIPSKDNADTLKNCIKSIRDKTAYTNYEILVIDNGSNAQNRMEIELLQEQFGFRYYYEPMEFNFSGMCNLGVDKAGGEYVLLLNDDMEILQPDWLTVMVGQASIEHVGAVGAKLLYPDSDKLQHVGISSIAVGPVHKLIGEHDRDCDYYYGRNVLPYDMIGVTGACLLVKREKYLEAGGFFEEAAVSYNDVDFCFSLHDLEYRNIIRNDVVLYHHESLSRGKDAVSAQKWDRLLREKELVYGRHPALNGNDPYYNPNLAGYKYKYFCSYLYPYERRECYSRIEPFKQKVLDAWKNECLIINLEHAKKEPKLNLKETEEVYWLEGWSYVLDMDNSRYKRILLLIDSQGNMQQVSIHDRYRQDVIDILPEQNHVGLSGFSCRIRRCDIEPGEYRVAFLYKDCCSRQKLYRECAKTLLVEKASCN